MELPNTTEALAVQFLGVGAGDRWVGDVGGIVQGAHGGGREEEKGMTELLFSRGGGGINFFSALCVHVVELCGSQCGVVVRVESVSSGAPVPLHEAD